MQPLRSSACFSAPTRPGPLLRLCTALIRPAPNTPPPLWARVYPCSEAELPEADPPSPCASVHSSLASSSHPGVELCSTAAWESF